MKRKAHKFFRIWEWQIALTPGLAPILGSYIAYTIGWKMCFCVVSFAIAIIIIGSGQLSYLNVILSQLSCPDPKAIIHWSKLSGYQLNFASYSWLKTSA